MSDTEFTRSIADPNVAQKDQSRAEALDALRRCESWVLFAINGDECEAYSVASFVELLGCADVLKNVAQNAWVNSMEAMEEAA